VLWSDGPKVSTFKVADRDVKSLSSDKPSIKLSCDENMIPSALVMLREMSIAKKEVVLLELSVGFLEGKMY
jgi:hypothetical protein